MIYTSIPDGGVSVDTSALVDEGYYAAPKPSSEKVGPESHLYMLLDVDCLEKYLFLLDGMFVWVST